MAENRGGAREGAGRKPVRVKKQAVSVALTPDALRVLKKLQDVTGAKNPSQTVDALLVEKGKTMKTDAYQRFWDMLDQCPRLSPYWNRERKEFDRDNFDQDFGVMSSGEKYMGYFFTMVWDHVNRIEFDVIGAVQTLDSRNRMIIANWISDPFFP